jgi:hypothetical protein
MVQPMLMLFVPIQLSLKDITAAVPVDHDDKNAQVGALGFVVLFRVL